MSPTEPGGPSAQTDRDSRPVTGGGRESFRAGYCALVGLPNVGKSTLLNRLVGERLSIVTSKPQTTRRQVLGIFTDERCQIVFVDTPGLLEPRYLLQRAMLAEATSALEDADVLVIVADAARPESLAAVSSYPLPEALPAILCLNQCDRAGAAAVKARLAELGDDGRWKAVVPTVATTGEGTDALREAIRERLPASPPYFPPEDLAAAPLRFFVAELVRETCFERLEQEVPYGIEIEVQEYREAEDPVYVSALVYVERESQKGIVIGKGGRTIRRIGTEARTKIERLIGRRVYLDLRVKVLANWRKRANRLRLLGFQRIPSEES